jgi:hypothetical protein
LCLTVGLPGLSGDDGDFGMRGDPGFSIAGAKGNIRKPKTVKYIIL